MERDGKKTFLYDIVHNAIVSRVSRVKSSVGSKTWPGPNLKEKKTSLGYRSQKSKSISGNYRSHLSSIWLHMSFISPIISRTFDVLKFGMSMRSTSIALKTYSFLGRKKKLTGNTPIRVVQLSSEKTIAH